MIKSLPTFGLMLSVAAAALPCGAAAQESSDVRALQQELSDLRAEQAKVDARMAALQVRLDTLTRAHMPDAAAPAAAPAIATNIASAANPKTARPAVAPIAVSALDVSGDIRLRTEFNTGDRDARDRNRATLRARLRASYAVTQVITAGGQIATGDPDDPNSSDVTLSNFDDDLQVSLDQAWLKATFGPVEIIGGKIPQPFIRTDMVWDGDVNPEGLSAAYKTKLGSSASFFASGLYFIIDESITGPDSRMIGGQIGGDAAVNQALKFGASVAYYDYSLKTIAGADAGDVRSNRFANGRYLSDFNLLDIIGSANWTGLGARWPVLITANYVHNLGATTNADTGILLNASAGRLANTGDWRIAYGYAQTGTDAVFAAFSEDNTILATNYLQHSMVIDYVISPSLILNGAFFRYKPKSVIDAGANDPNDWLNRVRINLMAKF
jgi:Putative porin